MRIIYKINTDSGDDMFNVIDEIVFARMVDTNLIELQLACATNDGNDIVYIEVDDEDTARRVVYTLFEVGKVDLTSEYAFVYYCDDSRFHDESDEELEEKMTENFDDFDEDDDYEDYI